MVDGLGFGEGGFVLKDFPGFIPGSDDIIEEVHAYELKNPVELLNEWQAFHSGSVPAGDNHHRRFTLDGVPQGPIGISEGLRPAIDKVFHPTGHPVPVEGSGENNHLMMGQLLHIGGIVIVHFLKSAGFVTEVIDGQNLGLLQAEESGRQSGGHLVCQLFRIAVFTGASQYRKDIHRD